MNDILILIPAYNEEDSIIPFLESMQDYLDDRYHVLVVNDGSSDRTLELVRNFGHGVEVISQVYNMGYGSALQLGYKYAVEHNFSYVIQMDGDGQHDACNIQAISRILEQPNAPDILIGSRFLPGSSTFRVSNLKKFALKMFKVMIRMASGQTITDATSGLQCLNRRAFSHYARFMHFDYQYPDANMIIQMCMNGYQVREFPATMHQRQSGVSMHAGIIKPAIYIVLMFVSIVGVYFRERRSRN